MVDFLITRVEEHKSDMRLKRSYRSVTARHTKECAECFFGWDTVQIMHYSNDKSKRELMETLYIKKEGVVHKSKD